MEKCINCSECSISPAPPNFLCWYSTSPILPMKKQAQNGYMLRVPQLIGERAGIHPRFARFQSSCTYLSGSVFPLIPWPYPTLPSQPPILPFPTACSNETETQCVFLFTDKNQCLPQRADVTTEILQHMESTILQYLPYKAPILIIGIRSRLSPPSLLPAKGLSFPGPEGSWGRISKEGKYEGQGFTCERWTEPDERQGRGGAA